MKQLFSLKASEEVPFHIKIDGSVRTMKIRKPNVLTRLVKRIQSIMAFIFAPIP